MSQLQHRQDLIKAKRMHTPRREFVRDIACWQSFTFYRNQDKISAYSPEMVKNVISPQEFNEMRGSYTDYGMEPSNAWLLHDLDQLIKNTPLAVMNQDDQSENVSYTDSAYAAKNAYLAFNVIHSEDVLYSYNIKSSTNVYESVAVWWTCENVFHSNGVIKSYNIFYSCVVKDCRDIWCSSNLIGCSECIWCDNLINQSYCISNIQYSKEEYLEKKKAFLAARSFSLNVNSTQFLVEAEDCENSNYIFNAKNIRNAYFVWGMKTKSNIYDVFSCGFWGDYYGCRSIWGDSQYAYCCAVMGNCNTMFYCFNCEGCSFCVGCVGLQNKTYCILNKQYTKEEWLLKIDEIFWKMEADWVLWDFFLPSMCPYYFNDTAAYIVDPSFTKEEVTTLGYKWRDDPIKVDIPSGTEIIESLDLEQYESRNELWNRTIDSDILKKVIKDEQGNYYRIIPMEYKFLMQHGLPLPRKHRLDRMKENFRIK